MSKTSYFLKFKVDIEVDGSDLKLIVKEGNRKVGAYLDGLELSTMFGNNEREVNRHMNHIISSSIEKLLKEKNIDWSK